MKEHIKKFPTIASADGYIIDAPFIASVVPATEGMAPTNIQCTEEGKKLKVEGGQISIVDAPLTFMIGTSEYRMDPDMTWAQWAVSEYNTNYPDIETDGLVILRWKSGYAKCLYKDGVDPSDDTLEHGSDNIIQGMTYDVFDWQ